MTILIFALAACMPLWLLGGILLGRAQKPDRGAAREQAAARTLHANIENYGTALPQREVPHGRV